MAIDWKSLFYKIAASWFVCAILGAIVSILLVMPSDIIIGESVVGDQPTKSSVALA